MERLAATLRKLDRADLLDRPLSDVLVDPLGAPRYAVIAKIAALAGWTRLGDLADNEVRLIPAMPWRAYNDVEPLLIAWATAQAARDQPDGPAPGAPLARVRAWAASAGVIPWLDAAAGPALDAYARDVRDQTVGELLAVPNATRTILDLQLRAGQFLRARAEEVARAVAAEERRDTRPPTDPSLRPLWDALQAERADRRAAVAPIAIKPPKITLNTTLAVLDVRIDARSRCCAGQPSPIVLTVRLDPAAGHPRAACACGGTGGCPYVLAGLDRVITALGGPLGAEIAAAVGRPAWSRRMDLLDLALDDDLVARRLSFRIRPARSVQIEAFDADDSEWRPDVGAPPVLGAADRELFALHTAARGANGEWATGALLRRLIGRPDVYDARGPAQVIEVPIAVSLERAASGVRVVVRAGGETVVPADLLANWHRVRGLGAISFRPGRVAVHVVDDRVSALLDHLARHGDAFPDEAVPALLERLPLLRAYGVDRVSEDLRGVEVHADPHPIVVIEAKPAALRVDVVVEPIAGGSRHAPGAGPTEVYARFSDGPRYAIRDLLAELELATALDDAIDPEGDGESPPWTLTDPDTIHDLLRRIDAIGDRVRVVWNGPPRRALRAMTARDLRVTAGAIDRWFAIGGEIRIDDVAIPLDRLLDALRRGERVVDTGGALLSLAEGYVDRLRALAGAVDHGALSPLAAGLIGDLAQDGAAIDATPEVRWAIDRRAAAESIDVAVPSGFVGELRDYQRDGVAFLARLAEWAPGALLCDDMGLGKTAQALALLLRRADRGPALVVAPMSVAPGWAREAARFAPSLRVVVHHGSSRGRELDLGPGDVLVTTWDILVRDNEPLAAIRFATIVLDEAHAAKNPDALRTRAARALNGEFRVGLTGTPLENRLSDLWSLASVVIPGLFGSWDQFRERYAAPIERDGDAIARAGLARAIAGFLLRRRKAEVAKELPARTEIVVFVDPTPAEKAVYDDARADAIASIIESRAPEAQRRFAALAALTALRLIACDPRLAKPKVGPGAKLERLREMIAEIVAEGHQALVFSQFTTLLAIVREALAKDRVKLRYLDGSTPSAQRQSEVAAFQAGDGDVFLISLKAGGTGLNLTSASYVFHLDPWWNPAAEDQATDRAHRIGQTRPVTVYKLVTRGTVEEGILAMQADKRALVTSVLDEVGTTAPFSSEELRDILGFGAITPVPRDAPPPDSGIARSPDDLRAAARRMTDDPPWLGLKPSTATAYGHVLQRVATFLAAEGRAWTAASSDAIVADYVSAVATGRFAAPKTDASTARAAMNKLRGADW